MLDAYCAYGMHLLCPRGVAQRAHIKDCQEAGREQIQLFREHLDYFALRLEAEDAMCIEEDRSAGFTPGGGGAAAAEARADPDGPGPVTAAIDARNTMKIREMVLFHCTWLIIWSVVSASVATVVSNSTRYCITLFFDYQ